MAVHHTQRHHLIMPLQGQSRVLQLEGEREGDQGWGLVVSVSDA